MAALPSVMFSRADALAECTEIFSGYRSIGYVTTVPLACMLLILVVRPLWDALRGLR